jgi:uridylate kinase
MKVGGGNVFHGVIQANSWLEMSGSVADWMRWLCDELA